MAVNKVEFGGTTYLDLTGDTVDAGHLLSGYTAHDKTGAQITGTATSYPEPSGKITITQNGTGIDVKDYAEADVNVPNPSTGTINITKNGTYNVTEKASAKVNVPNPSSGTLYITENGQYDVTNKRYADVEVEATPPTETIEITENGEYNVESCYMAIVNVAAKKLKPKSVNFWDFDGTLVASYTVSEAMELEELPDVPDHFDEGMTCEWNWTLEEIQNFIDNQPTTVINVGALCYCYGQTRLFIHVEERCSMKLNLCLNGSVTVDWGDNTTETLSGTSTEDAVSTATHTYIAGDDYTITIENDNQASIVIPYKPFILSGELDDSFFYRSLVRRVDLGDGISISGEEFAYCSNLESIIFDPMSSSMGSLAECHALKVIVLSHIFGEHGGSIGYKAFDNCSSLKAVCMPGSFINIAQIDESAFDNCPSLKNLLLAGDSVPARAADCCFQLEKVYIHGSCESIGERAFCDCKSLTSLTVPDGVTSIGKNFINGAAIKKLNMKPEVPPTITSETLSGLLSDCIIYVPANSLSKYKTATYWKTYASQIQGM